MGTPDTRVVLRGREVGGEGDPIVDHPDQPRDYFHADGTVWTWQDSWRMVGGVDLRVYDLMTRIALRVLTAAGDPRNPVVDHPGQPADYVHTDGTVWTWRERWRLLGGGHYLRVYDLVEPSTDSD
jgi:hypothetical protein